MAHTRLSVPEVLRRHWEKFGRAYYQREDFEELDAIAAREMMLELGESLSSLPGQQLGEFRVSSADDFSYTDPIDGSVASGQGYRILLEGGHRIVCRLSGTGTEGATLRLYLETMRNDQGAGSAQEVLASLARAAHDLLRLSARFGTETPTVIT